MTKMGVGMTAPDLRASHEKPPIFPLDNILRDQRLREARPTRAGVEFLLGAKERLAGDDIDIDPLGVSIPVGIIERSFRPLFLRHFVLERCQHPANVPFRRTDVFTHTPYRSKFLPPKRFGVDADQPVVRLFRIPPPIRIACREIEESVRSHPHSPHSPELMEEMYAESRTFIFALREHRFVDCFPTQPSKENASIEIRRRCRCPGITRTGVEFRCNHSLFRLRPLNDRPAVIAAFDNQVEFVKSGEHAAAPMLRAPESSIVIPREPLGIAVPIGIHRIAERIIGRNRSVVPHTQNFSGKRGPLLCEVLPRRIARGDVEVSIRSEFYSTAVVVDRTRYVTNNFRAIGELPLFETVTINMVLQATFRFTCLIEIDEVIFRKLRMECESEEPPFATMFYALNAFSRLTSTQKQKRAGALRT